MAYDIGKDNEDFLHGANDFAHARMAKKLVDAKKAAKAGGGMPPEAPVEAGEPDGDELPAEGDAPPLAEPPVEAEPGAGEKIPVEVTPEELAMLEQLRASKAPGMEAPEAGLAVKRGGPPRL